MALLPTKIAPGAEPSPRTPRAIERELRRRLEQGAVLRPAGEAKQRPSRLLAAGYAPRHRIDLFDTTYYLADVRQNPDVRFFVGYVARAEPGAGRDEIFPRILYKDGSLIWRSASHYVRTEEGLWLGKGEACWMDLDGEQVEVTDEATTDLPLEVQAAFETVSRRTRRIPQDRRAIELVLRRGPSDRIQAYRDFVEPRRRARADRRNLVNGGRPIARFTRRRDPGSLRFAAGFEPDFARGILEVTHSTSRLYGGDLARYRILSSNRRIQYLFLAGPRHVWIIPPQATTTELSSYGVRTIDVEVPEELCVPGYEYHTGEEGEDAATGISQIPPGFVGAVSSHDRSRADASPWLDRLPVIRAFRRAVLGAKSLRQRP